MTVKIPSTLEMLRERREEIVRLVERHGASSPRVFGSVARGDETSASDVDLLVAAGRETSPWFPAGLILDLEALLGRRVDVVTEDSIHRALQERIRREATPL